MIMTIVCQLSGYDFYLRCDEQHFKPFSTISNVHLYDKYLEYDASIRVTGSGFLVNNKVALMYAFSYFVRDLFKPKNIKKAVIGCNIEPFYNWLAEKIMRCRIRENDLITCRDVYSLDYIKKIAPKSKLFCFPDILFSMPENMFRCEKKGSNLGIVVVNRGYESYEEEMSKLADDYIEKRKENVTLFAFDSGLENDIETAQHILNISKHRESIKIVEYKGDYTTIINGFGECSTIVGGRFHANVLGLLMGKAIVPIYYGSKTKNLLLDIDFDREVFDIKFIDSIKLLNSVLDARVFDLGKRIKVLAAEHSQELRKWLDKLQ